MGFKNLDRRPRSSEINASKDSNVNFMHTYESKDYSYSWSRKFPKCMSKIDISISFIQTFSKALPKCREPERILTDHKLYAYFGNSVII